MRMLLPAALLGLFVMIITPLLPLQVALADPQEVVSVLDDSGPGSLRQAIADVDPGGEIVFQAGLTGTIELETELVIEKSLTITGPGAEVLTVSGARRVRVVHIDAPVSVTISGLTISNGHSAGIGGGGIRSTGQSLTIINSVVSGNTVGPEGTSFVQGGGIFTETGTLTIRDSVIASNTASAEERAEGGGVFAQAGTVFISNSAITGNSVGTSDGPAAEERGGGVFSWQADVEITSSLITSNSAGIGGGIYNNGTMIITNSTVSGNVAEDSGGGLFTWFGNSSIQVVSSSIAFNSAPSASNIHILDGEVTLESTIVTRLSAAAPNCGTDPNYNGRITSNDYNLISDTSCFEEDEERDNDLIGIDPALQPLDFYGGQTRTHAITADSPAFNAGGSEPCAAETDQRGTDRPQLGACDIGAFELTLPAPTLTLPSEPVVVEATGPEGVPIEFDHLVSATNFDDETLVVDCDPASGSTFDLGDTPANCSATDEFGQTTEGSFTVTVQDTTPPVITQPEDIIVGATGPAGATVNYDLPEVVDLVDQKVTATCLPVPGTPFAIGSTTVTCSATDASGNDATDISFTVTVIDGLQQLDQLIDDVRGGPGSMLVKPRLLALLAAADLSLHRGQTTGTCASLSAFSALANLFGAVRLIPSDTAAEWSADALNIQRALGCGGTASSTPPQGTPHAETPAVNPPNASSFNPFQVIFLSIGGGIRPWR